MSGQETREPAPEVLAELATLADRYCAELLTDSDVARLESLLQNGFVQRAFLERVEIHAGLHWLLRGAAEPMPKLTERDPPATVPIASAQKPMVPTILNSRTFRSVAGWAAALLLVAAGAWSLFRGVEPPRNEPLAEQPAVARPTVLATVTEEVDAQWLAEDDAAPRLGNLLGPGVIELSGGLVRLQFADGASLLIEAPSRLEIVGPSEAKLLSGRVVVRCAKPLRDFVLRTSAARVVDLGTEFGVSCSDSGSTVVQVYEGKVRAEAVADAAVTRDLHAGQSLRIDERGPTSAEIPFDDRRFVRALPQNSVHPSNDSQHDEVRAPRAPRDVVIDGDLADWDLRYRFRSECRGEFGASYYLEGAAMYDDRYLYVGAHVGDPAPMQNEYDPEFDPGFAWRGGGMHLRVAADASFPWPLEVESEIYQRLYAKRNPTVPVSPQVAGLYMWYFAPRQEACLLRYPELVGGVPRGKILRDDVQGKFRRDADGRGYVLEYAIPWRELNVPRPPQPGDRWPAIWHVHWSADGSKHLGHLIDVTNPAERPNLKSKTMLASIFHRAVMWGRLKFEAPEAPDGSQIRRP